MKIFGWSPEQIAVAAAYYETVEGPLPPATLEGLAKVRLLWVKRRQDAPSETKFIGITPKTNHTWAAEILKNPPPYLG